MLNTQLKLHREFLLAHVEGQKLFAMLTLTPSQEAVAARPQLDVAFVVDTSGSMYEVVTKPSRRTGQTMQVDGKTYEVVEGAKSKIELVVESLKNIFNSGLLVDDDRIALIKFDDRAKVILPFTPARDKKALLDAAALLTKFSGGTHMGAGMKEAANLLDRESGSRRMILLSDGQTFDEAVCQSAAEFYVKNRIPVTTVGVGDDVNTDLLLDLTNRTQGQAFDVVPDNQNPQPPSVRASDLPKALLGDIKQAAAQVITNVELSVRTVKDVELTRVTRVSPTQTEVDLRNSPFPLGNVEAGQGSIFILEFTLPARIPARVRLAQIGLTYLVPGKNFRGELPPMDVIAEFTSDETRAGVIAPDVMQWVQQRNIEMLVAQATKEAQQNPVQAQKTLELARSMTQRLGNNNMTQALDRALEELNTSKTISLGTAKTLRIGAKTQTIQSGQNLPSDEEIRRITGA
ncbi:vWA domain-containing protein [Deinococcus misasensis]|uniref:vWA domain-containing protein n=1 Tax=Deinococcus misasensis TaxID=392413 RepID=UPI00054DF699|nr:VWA domain-containing protein [Deinococcus misasensis]